MSYADNRFRLAPNDNAHLRELSEISHMCAAQAIQYIRKEQTP